MGELFIPNTQRLRRVERLEIEPRDFDDTLRYWKRLGFAVTIKGALGSREGALKAGDLRLRLKENRERALDRRRAPFPALRVVLSVTSFDAYLAELRDKEIECGEPFFAAGTTRAVELIDPDGIRILIEEAG